MDKNKSSHKGFIMINPLGNFQVKDWYHIMIVAGFFLFLLSLTVPLIGVDNNVIQLFSLSMFFYGFGEMLNHPLQQKLRQADEYCPTPMVGTGHPRKNSIVGIFFLFVSASLFVASAYKLLF